MTNLTSSPASPTNVSSPHCDKGPTQVLSLLPFLFFSLLSFPFLSFPSSLPQPEAIQPQISLYGFSSFFSFVDKLEFSFRLGLSPGTILIMDNLSDADTLVGDASTIVRPSSIRRQFSPAPMTTGFGEANVVDDAPPPAINFYNFDPYHSESTDEEYAANMPDYEDSSHTGSTEDGPSGEEIIVVGAGVIGLNVALELAVRGYASYVTVVAEFMPGDNDPLYASPR